MNKEIQLENLLSFQNEYQNNPNNLIIEKSIKEKGLKKTCLNKDLANFCKYEFNVEIPRVKIYDQKNSYQCNTYAFLRVIKSIMQKENPSLDIDALDLSANYLDFYDKLEKINTLYNDLLSQNNLTLEMINEKVNRYVGIYGTFHFCRELVKKYGLVPTKAMPEVNNHYSAFETLEVLKAKIKSDATLLLNKKGLNKNELKTYLMKEAYNVLSKVMGNPPLKFKWDKEECTPIEFRDKYLNTNLDDFITVVSYDKETFFNSYSFIPNVYLGNTEYFTKLSVPKMKEAVLKQLQDGIAVWFSAEESTTLDYDLNILDSDIYKYKDLFNIKELSKNDRLTLDLVNYDHAMCITGALVDRGEIIQFKVDNSFEEHGKYKGHLIMTNSFFANDIITMIIHKKYIR